MKHSTNKQEKYTQITIEEEKLDAVVSPDLKGFFVNQHGEGVKNFILDLSHVKYVDSSGLSAILIGNRLCNEANGTLVLTGVTEHVMKLIRISQLEKVLSILPTVEEGVDLVFMNDLENNLKNGIENDN